MIELKENAIRYYKDNLVFSISIDIDDDVSFKIYDKNIMEYIHTYILNISFDLPTEKKEQFLKQTLIDHVCNYYDKQKQKFISEIVSYQKEEKNNE